MKSTLNKIKTYILLHILLMFYSMSGICSKIAAGTQFLSFKFFVNYGCVLALLVLYAIGWQQIIKKLPLTLAFANKAVTIFWGMVWGILVFHERVSLGKIVGALMVIAGVVLYSISDKREGEKHE
mgnify:FL=1